MRTPRHAIPAWAATCTVSSLLLSLVSVAATSDAPASTVAHWPKSFAMPSGALVTINQPQIAEWPNESAVTFYAVASYAAKGTAKPAMGTIVVEANTTVAFGKRLVHFSRFSIVDASFPTLTKAQRTQIIEMLEKHLPPDGRTMTLDAVLAAVASHPPAAANAGGIKEDPPVVFVSHQPAIIVNLDGSPIWRPAAEELMYAVNTNWDLFHHAPSHAYFLRNGREWLAADDVLGPWRRARALPPTFDHLPAQRRWEGVKAALPIRPGGAPPKVYVSRLPAELIVIAGQPVYRRVSGTANLNWISNTDADVFRDGVRGPVYYLVSGRWFSAPDLTGPWAFATHHLPADFRKIPLDHPRSHVLASVPGTVQASEAVLLAEVPRLARVNKKALQAPAVTYDGAPLFQLIAGTPILRAQNTDKDVLKGGRQYYLCVDGVWFVGRAATGPWKVTGDIPASIFQIPPSSPSYRVTQVTVHEDYDDWTVFCATAAYENMIVAGDVVVWGTGYSYAPYIGGSAGAPVYFEPPPTYGEGAWYNPWTTSFGRARQRYGPPAAAPLGRVVYAEWDPRLVQTEDRSNPDATSATVGTTGQLTTVSRPTSTSNLFAGRDGNVYRERSLLWERYQNGVWVPLLHLRPSDEPIVRQLLDDRRARAEGVQQSRVAMGLQNEWGVRAASYRPSSVNQQGGR